jgi:hypothetical protein
MCLKSFWRPIEHSGDHASLGGSFHIQRLKQQAVQKWRSSVILRLDSELWHSCQSERRHCSSHVHFSIWASFCWNMCCEESVWWCLDMFSTFSTLHQYQVLCQLKNYNLMKWDHPDCRCIDFIDIIRFPKSRHFANLGSLVLSASCRLVCLMGDIAKKDRRTLATARQHVHSVSLEASPKEGECRWEKWLC